jgi:hypothetical protein
VPPLGEPVPFKEEEGGRNKEEVRKEEVGFERG